MRAVRRFGMWLPVAVLLGGGGAEAGQSGQQEAQKPEREIVAAFEYPRVEVEPSTSLSLDLIVKNNGRKDEVVLLELVESPAELKSKIEDYSKGVGGLFVASGERKTIRVNVKPKLKPEDREKEKEGKKINVPPGTYKFVVKASTEDGKLEVRATGQLTVKSPTEEGEAPKDPITITCSYPNLRGANDSDFKFSIDIHNNTDAEDMASLRAEAPKGWDVTFKPSYESKYIGSLKVEANLSKSVDVEVKPPPGAEVGKYPITVFSKLSKKDLEAKKELSVELTGTYRIQCRTANEVLSLTAKGGRESNISMYVLNRGTATQNGVTFDSFKPENWKVTFKPERIEKIEPGKMEQVEVVITPNADALVGDYSVTVTARGEKATHDVELRVTVKPSTTWAWVGVGIVVAVIVVLSVMFKVMGRR